MAKYTLRVSLLWHPSIILFLSMIVSRAMDFLFKGILSRMLGPEQFGIIQQYETYFEILVVLSVFGFNTAVLKYVSEKRHEEEAKRTFSLLTKLSIVVSLFFCVMIYSIVYFSPIMIEEKVRLFLEVSIFVLPLFVLTHPSHGLVIHFMNAINRIHYVAILKVVYYSVQLIIGMVILYLFGFNAYGFAILLMAVISFLYCFSILKKNWIKSPRLFKKNEEMERMYPLIGYSALSNISAILIGYIDILVVVYFFSNKIVGLYGVASLIVKGLWILPIAIMQVEIPKISRGYEEKRLDVFSYYKSLLKKMMKLCWPLVVVVFAFSYFIVKYIFGQEYVEIVPVLQLLLVTTMFYSLTLVGGAVFIATSYPKINLLLNLGRASLNVMLFFGLIPYFGIMGVAIASLVTFLVYFLIQYRVCKNIFKGKAVDKNERHHAV